MRRIAVLALSGFCIAWAIAASLGGCSTEETPATPKKDAGRTSSSSSGGDDNGGSTSSSSSSSSSSGGGDAAADAAPVALSNPRKVTCAAKECDLSKPEEAKCCWPDNDAGAGTCGAVCEAAVGLELECDESADCGDAGVGCCLTFNGSSCDDGSGCTEGPRLCKLDSECTVAGEKCNLIDCKRGGSTIKIRTCTNGVALPNGCDD